MTIEINEIKNLINSNNIEDRILGFRMLYELDPREIEKYDVRRLGNYKITKKPIILKFPTLCVGMGNYGLIRVHKNPNHYDGYINWTYYDYRNNESTKE